MMTCARFVAPLVAVAVLAGCGANASSTDLNLSPAGEAGRTIANSNGCAACHGADGGGNIGPPFVGLFGSSVELESGETITADREYLVESIVDPDAATVAGYRLPMPTNNLSPDEVDSVVIYIVELADQGAAE